MTLTTSGVGRTRARLGAVQGAAGLDVFDIIVTGRLHLYAEGSPGALSEAFGVDVRQIRLSTIGLALDYSFGSDIEP